MTIQIRNIRDGSFNIADPTHLYVGRQQRYIKAGQPSFGNPYSHMAGTAAAHQVADRDAACDMYDRTPLTVEQEAYLKANPQITTIYCHCAPLRCHGTSIAARLEALKR